MLAVAAVARPDDAAAFSFPASALPPSTLFRFPRDLCGNTAGLLKAAFGARTALPDASVNTRDLPLASISHRDGRVVASDNACRCRALWMLRDESSPPTSRAHLCFHIYCTHRAPVTHFNVPPPL